MFCSIANSSPKQVFMRRALVTVPLLAFSLSGCMSGTATRGLAGATLGGVLADATGGNALSGALVGGALGIASCGIELGLPPCEKNY